MRLFRLVDLVLHLNIISLSITVRVVSLASLLSIDGLSLWHRSKSSQLRHKYRLRWSYFTQLNPTQIIIPTKTNPQKTFLQGAGIRTFSNIRNLELEKYAVRLYKIKNQKLFSHLVSTVAGIFYLGCHFDVGSKMNENGQF